MLLDRILHLTTQAQAKRYDKLLITSSLTMKSLQDWIKKILLHHAKKVQKNQAEKIAILKTKVKYFSRNKTNN